MRDSTRLVRTSAPRLDRLPSFTRSGDVLAVIEATQYTRIKLKFDGDLGAFLLEKVLPAGMSYPYDFGFIPSTCAADGDPLDILVLNDEPTPAGFVVPCKLVGVLVAEQSDRGRLVRNDRLLGVATASRRYRSTRVIRDISADVLRNIEVFFARYNEERGVRFKPKGRHGAAKALSLLKRSQRQDGDR